MILLEGSISVPGFCQVITMEAGLYIQIPSPESVSRFIIRQKFFSADGFNVINQ